MLIIVPVEKQSSPTPSNVLSMNSHDLSLCPEKAECVAFLQLMDGWL